MAAKASKVSFVLMIIAGIIMLLWGVAHIIPTRSVVHGLGLYDLDSERIVTMEWVAEGFTLIFLGVMLIFLAPYVAVGNTVARGAALLSVLMLAAMAIWGGATGARTELIFLKICPFVKSLCALSALIAVWIRVGNKG